MPMQMQMQMWTAMPMPVQMLAPAVLPGLPAERRQRMR